MTRVLIITGDPLAAAIAGPTPSGKVENGRPDST